MFDTVRQNWLKFPKIEIRARQKRLWNDSIFNSMVKGLNIRKYRGDILELCIIITYLFNDNEEHCIYIGAW